MNSQDKSTPKIGIVIPIYNVAPYFRECLDSVANQTYGNFHAVLVNDGSIDNSKEIALEYVAKDSRFVLIDKKNGGQSSARNAGIDYFNGEIESSLQNSTNYTIFPSLRDSTNRAPISSLQGKAEAIHKNKIDYHDFANADSCNDESCLYCHNLALSNLAMTSEGESSLRGSEADEAIQKNKKIDCHELANADSRNDESFLDCHDFATQNLAMTAKSIYANATPPQIDYIIFLDSDDFWELDLLERCVDSALKHNAQIVWFSWKTFYDGIDNPSVNGGGGNPLGLAFMATHKRAS